MHVVIDYTYAICQQEGVARYTRSLVDALAQIDTEDRITLFSTERPRLHRGFPVAPNMRPIVVPIGSRAMAVMWQRARLPVSMEAFTGPADVVHGPFLLPRSIAMRSVITIHDVAHLTIPDYVAPSNARYLKKLIHRIAKHADHVITDSACTANDLESLLGVPREKVTAVHLGVDRKFAPVRDSAQLADFDARYGMMHPLVLAIGTIEPRKRYDALVAAFAHARTSPGGPRMLAIAGPRGWRAEETVAAINTYDVADSVKLLDFVPEADLATLYSTADVLAMPARYEGFGLPTIEAMACGTPVVCSATGSLPEVTGDAAIHVNVEAEGALANALTRVLADEGLRQTLIARGLERARDYTWERAARAVLDVYRMVAKTRHVHAKRNED
jgi:glycosyltransferase involved in cell wall biosynthesis